MGPYNESIGERKLHVVIVKDGTIFIEVRMRKTTILC